MNSEEKRISPKEKQMLKTMRVSRPRNSNARCRNMKWVTDELVTKNLTIQGDKDYLLEIPLNEGGPSPKRHTVEYGNMRGNTVIENNNRLLSQLREGTGTTTTY